MAADVRDYTALEGGLASAVERFGRLDILVNSAAGNFLAPAAGLSANGFKAVIDIDLNGTFNACRAAFAHLSARGGSILSITATQAWVPTPLQCHAGAAKAGIAKLTQDLALEWGASNIRVNALAPGPIAGTEGMRRLAPIDASDRGQFERALPLKRWGTVDEIADAALFLVSPAASFITGTTLVVDGGQALIGSGAHARPHAILVGASGMRILAGGGMVCPTPRPDTPPDTMNVIKSGVEISSGSTYSRGTMMRLPAKL